MEDSNKYTYGRHSKVDTSYPVLRLGGIYLGFHSPTHRCRDTRVDPGCGLSKVFLNLVASFSFEQLIDVPESGCPWP